MHIHRDHFGHDRLPSCCPSPWRPRSEARLHRQVYRELARLILAGRLAPGSRLPSSRDLARELGVARNTILSALDQLASEGYVEGRRGSGTLCRGRSARQDAAGDGGRPCPRGRGVSPAAPVLAARAAALVQQHLAPPRRSGLLAPGLADVGEFPFELWARLLARSWRRPTQALATGGSPGGLLALRQAIADYLRLLRGVRCEAEQVIIVSGTRQGLDLTARLLLRAGRGGLAGESRLPGSARALDRRRRQAGAGARRWGGSRSGESGSGARRGWSASRPRISFPWA